MRRLALTTIAFSKSFKKKKVKTSISHIKNLLPLLSQIWSQHFLCTCLGHKNPIPFFFFNFCLIVIMLKLMLILFYVDYIHFEGILFICEVFINI